MKILKNSKTIKKLNQCELASVKGGNERDYVIVIIDGKPTKVYV